MILHMGVRTTEQKEVAFKSLEPGDQEATAISELLSTLVSKNPYAYNSFDHSMVVFYDPPNTPNRRRELMIPVQRSIDGIQTKIFPSLRVAFLVFKGTDTPMKDYYSILWNHIEDSGLEVSQEIYCIEIMYVPEDVDEQDYTLEIMIPLAR